ncbi:MAG: Hsp20/alpha crystallin family protein [Rickettsia endosymbiont of Argas persicus]
MKNILVFIITILFSTIAGAEHNNTKLVPLSQTINRLSNIENYLNNILIDGLPFNESTGIKSRFITKDTKYIIIMEVPGFDKNQIKVKVNGNKLFINGNIENKNKEDDSNNYINKSFNYVISLYDDVDQKNISSNLKNGILTISIPRIKLKEQDAREIKID